VKKKSFGLLQLLSDFFTTYLPTVRGVSHNTITSYQYAFQLLFEFMSDVEGLPPEKVKFESLMGGTVIRFLNWLEVSRGCSVKTRNQRRAAIASFAKYALKAAFNESAAFGSEILEIPKKKVAKDSTIRYFTKEEVGLLIRLPDTSRIIGQRNAVLLSVLYSSGARAQEICDLTMNDISFGNQTVIRLFGKGNKGRSVTIPENCATLLKKYLESRNLIATGKESKVRHVFSSQTHEKMTIACVEEIVKKYVKLAKTEHPDKFRCSSYSPHSFRHSIAVHMLECGVPLPVIQAFLGHESISSTIIYASVTPELTNKYLKNRDVPSDGFCDWVDDKKISIRLPFLRGAKKFN
jgi:site-specific recombinase XerD